MYLILYSILFLRSVIAHSWISCTNTIVYNFGDIFEPNNPSANTTCYGYARAYPEPSFFARENTDEIGLFADQGRQTYVWSNGWDTEGRTISKRQITTNGIPAYFPGAPMARARPGDTIRLQIIDPNFHAGPNDAGWIRIFWGGGVGKTLTQESQLTDDKIVVYQSWQRAFPHRRVNGNYYDQSHGYVDLPLVDTKGHKLKPGMHSYTYTWGDDFAIANILKNGQKIAARIGFVNVFEVFIDYFADPVNLLPWPLSAENDLLTPTNPVFNNQNYNNITGTTQPNELTAYFGGVPSWNWIGFSADPYFGYKIPIPPNTQNTKTIYGLPGSIKYNTTTNLKISFNYTISQYRYGQFGGSSAGNRNF